MNRFYTVEQVREMLKYARVDSVLAHLAELRAVNISSRSGRSTWRIPAEALEEFLRARTVAPTPKPVKRRRRKWPAETPPDYFPSTPGQRKEWIAAQG
jgi:hypothetical protein